MTQPLRLAAFLAFMAFPILEIGLLIRTGQSIGFWRLALIVVATAMLGGAVIRRTGLRVLTRARAQMARGHFESGRNRFEPLFDGLVQLTAGMLLIFPGLISDAIGLILLIPVIRNFVVTIVLPRLVTVAVFGSDPQNRQNSPFQRGPEQRGARPSDSEFDPESGSGPTIEGEYERVSEKPVPPERSLKPNPPRRSSNS
jgi:UPF0716 protein FxsA